MLVDNYSSFGIFLVNKKNHVEVVTLKNRRDRRITGPLMSYNVLEKLLPQSRSRVFKLKSIKTE